MSREQLACRVAGCFDVIEEGAWGGGPWVGEVSRVDFKHFGLDCFVHRNGNPKDDGAFGDWCGYVGVSRKHPAFGTHYDGIDVQVHGGLTYAAKCGHHLCHEKPAARWWLGFDCAHAGDYMPGMEWRMR